MITRIIARIIVADLLQLVLFGAVFFACRGLFVFASWLRPRCRSLRIRYGRGARREADRAAACFETLTDDEREAILDGLERGEQ